MNNKLNFEKIALEKFNISNLKPFQKQVIENILYNYENNEKNDLLVILKTGGGKSICFLLPSIMVKGLTILVYPLISLMYDQKRRLKQSKINSIIIEGNQNNEERKNLFQKIENKEVKIIITNPESLENEDILNQLRKYVIDLFVIDEAHTICKWGLTFRPSYINLGKHIKTLHVKQILSFTATADKNTIKALAKYLFFYEKYTIIKGEIDRENIFYHSIFSFSKLRDIFNIVSKRENRPAIVFCKTRKTTFNLYKSFFKYNIEFQTYYYHAGLNKEHKIHIENAFFKSNNALLFSTIAFGLGMDKPNIRTVIHYSIEKTDELSFLQESGRAGRDGLNSSSYVLIGKEELQAKYLKKEKDNIIDIFVNNKCIRKQLCSSLNEELTNCSGCDICNNTFSKNIDGLNIVISLIKFNQFTYTINEATKLLNGEEEYNIANSFFCLLNNWESSDIREIINNCLSLKILFLFKGKLVYNYFFNKDIKKLIFQREI